MTGTMQANPESEKALATIYGNRVLIQPQLRITALGVVRRRDRVAETVYWAYV